MTLCYCIVLLFLYCNVQFYCFVVFVIALYCTAFVLLMFCSNCYCIVHVQVESVGIAEEKALEREAKNGMGEDEAVFSVESALEQTYEWSDKYRPRKPRYFNRSL